MLRHAAVDGKRAPGDDSARAAYSATHRTARSNRSAASAATHRTARPFTDARRDCYDTTDRRIPNARLAARQRCVRRLRRRDSNGLCGGQPPTLRSVEFRIRKPRVSRYVTPHRGIRANAHRHIPGMVSGGSGHVHGTAERRAIAISGVRRAARQLYGLVLPR